MEIPDHPLTRPSYTQPKLLSDLLVRNRRILERIVTLGEDSASTGGRHHVLLVGPPGSGKTHLAVLAAARLERRTPKARRPLVARLPEIPWGITSFADLLLAILENLVREGKVSGPAGGIQTLADLPPGEVAPAAAGLLRDAAGGRALLLVLENLDQVFTALGEEGQKEFRAFLQQDPFTSVLATSRRLFDQVTRRTSPFYGFFRVERMEALSPQNALSLAGKVLEKFGAGGGQTPASRPEAAAWIRAVHHVSGGNARFCLLFALGLARGASFLQAFFDALDRVSPLYLGEVQAASPQQRKILDHLSGRGGAVQVKEIARSCLATEQTVSSQLRDLRKAGLAAVTRVGRNSFYEISDPLLRISMVWRKGGASSIQDLLSFLSHWYRPEGKADERLREILQRGPLEGKWAKAVPSLLQASRKEGTLPFLGAALVRALKPLFDSHLPEEAQRAWLETWKGKGAGLPGLALPLRLLEAALQEKTAPPSSAYLALPREEREILLTLLAGPPS